MGRRRKSGGASPAEGEEESSQTKMETEEEEEVIGIGSGSSDDKTSADYYFDSYSHFGKFTFTFTLTNSFHFCYNFYQVSIFFLSFFLSGIHEEMLKDVVRTKTYQNVIYQNSFLFKDKVVLDVGAGTGILSLFCAKSGAKHVYAIECSQMADMAKEIVRVNGLSNVITVLEGKVEEIELPIANVDVIISEWMGYFLLFENMLNTVLYARDKWLVNDGAVLPDKAALYLTAIEDAEYKDDKIEFWDNVYGFNMSCIKKQAMMEPLVDTVDPNQIVTNSQLLKTMDISKMSPGDASFTASFKLIAERTDYIHALVAYFDVSFTKCHKLMGFSTGPKSKSTHWKQTVLYLEDVISICEGEAIIGSMTVEPNKRNPRDVDIMLKYSFNGQHCQMSRTQHYKMR
ncbi:Protein arginine N-methyltransferase 1.1 [Rhynchospora pubera]|uniref:Protein arginine N-methyltransferase 1 n=1 Tax=Rhynchospora pubera TaxID=906938 RepID=A0AAV8C0Y4_9POAL|nr:Protein arginine N-methyltransferase 1.1 [Rhynchospora pubera]